MRQDRWPGDDPPGPIDRGRPGASARAEYERRRAADDQRRRDLFGRGLGRVVRWLGGERPSTSAWDRGSRGEVRVGGRLDRAVGPSGVVLHDRAVPGRRGNIDHIAIVASGVWVIDTKRYRGRVQRGSGGGWRRPGAALVVNGRDRTALIPAVARQAAHVRRVTGAGVPMHAALCFTDADWGPLARPFTIDGVTVTGPRRLAGALAKPGGQGDVAIRLLARRIAATFPPHPGPETGPGQTPLDDAAPAPPGSVWSVRPGRLLRGQRASRQQKGDAR
ncbi:MAG: nuclease-related domain-containing protein [Acidimicrobiales bacterium]